MFCRLKYRTRHVCLFTSGPTLLKGDHHYPGSHDDLPTVVLYAEIGRPAFHLAHKELRVMAQDRKIHYVLRHYIKVRTHAFPFFSFLPTVSYN